MGAQAVNVYDVCVYDVCMSNTANAMAGPGGGGGKGRWKVGMMREISVPDVRTD